MRRLWKMTISLLLSFSALILLCQPVFAAGAVQKKTVKREISIVFDNSGTMYSGGKKTWCQATYATEVFASMLNKGDVLKIYPMNEITVGGKTYTSEDPLVISDPSEAKKVRDIYTPHTSITYTPIYTITDAGDGARKSKLDEKWMIIITDGSEFYEKQGADSRKFLNDSDGKLDTQATKKRLTEVLSGYANAEKAEDRVNVLYLGIGDVKALPTLEGGTEDSKSAVMTTVPEDLPAMLCDMCNKIFGRAVLPASNIKGNSMEFDIPMSKIIVFAQGSGVTGAQLGKLKASSTREVKYSENPGYSKNPGDGSYQFDDTLQGIIATFENVEAGKYDLSFTGDPSRREIYYEPDADLKIDLVDAGKKSVLKDTAQIVGGKYALTYCITDSNGKDISASKLLGDKKFTVDVKLNGKQQEINNNGASGEIPFTLNAGDKLEVGTSKVTFLKDYTIEKTGADTHISNPITVVSAENMLTLNLSGGSSSYLLPELEEKGIYDLTVVYDGKELPAAEFAKVEFSAAVTGGAGAGNPVAEITKDGARAQVALKYHGDASSTNLGPQTLFVSASYKDAFNNEAIGGVQTEFEIAEPENTLLVTVSGGSQSYKLSELEEKGVYQITATHNGAPLTAEEFERLELMPVTVTGGEGEGNPTAEVTRESDRMTLSLKYNGDAAHTSTGEQSFGLSFVYTNEYGNQAFCEQEVKFAVVDDTSILTAEISILEDYYVLSKIGDETPVILSVKKDGASLSDEELSAIAANGGILTEPVKGLSLGDFEPIPGKSAFSAKINKSGTKTGVHKLKCSVSMPDTRNRRTETALAEGFVEIESMPKWVKILIILGILLLLAGLILFILTRKILPKDVFIKQDETEFKSGRNVVQDFRPVRYGKKNIFARFAKEASITVTTPQDSSGNEIPPVRLKIRSLSNVKDAIFNKKQCRVRAVIAEPSTEIEDLTVSGENFTLNKKDQHFYDADDKPVGEHPVVLREGSDIETVAKSQGYLRTVKMIYNTNLHFKW